MHAIVDIPINTTLADLDEGLRQLIESEFARHGLSGVNVSFDAPTRDWAATLSAPTIDLFLYDIREDRQRRTAHWDGSGPPGERRETRPALRVEASYAVTAWTRNVEDEHRLLSQVLGILYAHPVLPAEALVGTLAAVADGIAPEATVGRPRADGRSEFWTAVGGQYKASVDYAVALAFPSGVTIEQAPPVRTRVLRAEMRGERVEERHTLTGRALDAGGGPAPGCWLMLPDVGRASACDRDGAFAIDGLPSGRHRCVARDEHGRQAEGWAELPGVPLELTLAGRR